MDLLSAFKRKKPAAADAADSVQLARTRARQRLIGAAVLVIAGIVGFPLLFETEPRPLPVDLPIEIPSKENAAPLTLPPSASSAAKAESKPVPKSAPVTNQVIDETAADAGREVKTDAASAPAAAEAPASRAIAAAEEAPKKKAAALPQADTGINAAAADAARAKALLEGKLVASTGAPASAPGSPRFVVQVGAFTDPAAVRSARAKVERLGLATYTQVAQTSAGARTRVRVGPFPTRAEAERAAARIKAADLPTVILAL